MNLQPFLRFQNSPLDAAITRRDDGSGHITRNLPFLSIV